VQQGLYDIDQFSDSCGFGLIAKYKGAPSHKLIQQAIDALTCMTHRGGIASDGKTGDGCGLQLQMPDAFMRHQANMLGYELGNLYAVGFFMLSQNKAICKQQMDFVESVIGKKLKILCWRDIPYDESCLGSIASEQKPTLKQLFVDGDGVEPALFRAMLMVLRKQISYNIPTAIGRDFYIASLCSEMIVYKGLMMPADLSRFYLDLNDPLMRTSICVFHQRFSTNTLPKWRLAQPFRMLAHNGEINTIVGNRNWAMARSELLTSPIVLEALGEETLQSIAPVVNLTGSDSSSLDNMLEYLVVGGLDIHHAIRLLVPPAWKNKHQVPYKRRAFFEYNAMHFEPWDGPAGLVMSDGVKAICCLDRNGLRPSRWCQTDDLLIVASEAGVLQNSGKIIAKGKLGPGEIISVDTQTGKILTTDAIDQYLSEQQPYSEWLKQRSTRIKSQVQSHLADNKYQAEKVVELMKLHNVTYEEYDQVLQAMCHTGQEPTGSMGDDTPIAVLSRQNRPIYDYFRQQFAQVTNPPIDPLRESIVMSLETIIGRYHNIFDQKQIDDRRIAINSPLLSASKFEALKGLASQGYLFKKISLGYDPKQDDLKTVVANIAQQCCQIAHRKKLIIILSDKDLKAEHIPAQALLVAGAVHQKLSQQGLRSRVNIIVETGSVRDSHQVACLIGYGATAVYPYLSYSIINLMHERKQIDLDADKAQLNYRKAINKGLLKIISKMGISTISSYRGAQLFEAVGIADEVVELCFGGTISRIGGCNFEHFQNKQQQLYRLANNPNRKIAVGGIYKYVHDSEYHAYNPDVVVSMHKAVRNANYLQWKLHSQLVDQRPAAALRDLLKVNSKQQPIKLDTVEAATELYPRFNSAGMSLGALSPEAHEALAQAMNELGGMSNSGEGGESVKRFNTPKNSAIKQIASGRFGVTANYLVSAKVIQIKIAQGAKPGEGGQLPGSKVTPLIASLRFSIPGVTLISPPPHHDIYSIEDLAQLIYDLKEVNQQAKVSVKLVSRPGIGTIAVGVAKAGADLITISGYDGGTAASPLGSIRYTGSPWELGIAEVQQMLQINGMRDKVILQVDGGLKTGLDVVKAAILGAESFGFGTGPMIALGCKYLRICHLNNCATGVATQNDQLRKQHFVGLVSHAKNYFKFIATEVRELLADLGYRQLTDIIGKVGLLQLDEQKVITEQQRNISFSKILHSDALLEQQPRYYQNTDNQKQHQSKLADKMLQLVSPYIKNRETCHFEFEIHNYDRTIGGNIAGAIAREYGQQYLPKHTINLIFNGSAGQSFGAWNVTGMSLRLFGEANDYVGKGMTGGEIVISPMQNTSYQSQHSSIIGNPVLYGATGGTLFASGQAGERFAVRNSGATAVIEGAGDHCCEYMTGGVVVVLGSVGVNFGAGMTGGIAYVLDENNALPDYINSEHIEMFRLTRESQEPYDNYLHQLLQDYVNKTDSEWGQTILSNYDQYLQKFWLILPSLSNAKETINTILSRNE